MHIYRLLIMFGHVMGWALVWAIGGPGPQPRPLVRLLWAWWILLKRSIFAKSLVIFVELSA